MKKILIATTNEGKKREMLEVFDKLEVDFLSLSDFDPVEEPDETGKNFEENALIKAQFFSEKLGLPAIGEDSGLILEAFPEKFGLRTRREFNAEDDTDWLRQFLDLLEGSKNRRATFFSAMTFFDPETGTKKTFLGKTSGKIVDFPQAPLEKGIPVSAVFLSDGENLVYSALSRAQKNKISHRGKAAKLMLEFLRQKI